jgi:hypothetical protein
MKDRFRRTVRLAHERFGVFDRNVASKRCLGLRNQRDSLSGISLINNAFSAS